MSIEVLVEKVARSGQAFVSESVWYNFYKNGKQAKLPASIVEGATATITKYEENDRGHVDFTAGTGAGGGSSTPSAPRPKTSGGGNDARQVSIERQNALTNAVSFTIGSKGGEATTDDVLAALEIFYNAVHGGASTGEETKAAAPKAKPKAPPPKPATRKRSSPPPVDDGDDEPDFDADE